jgi:hypothetical protein
MEAMFSRTLHLTFAVVVALAATACEDKPAPTADSKSTADKPADKPSAPAASPVDKPAAAPQKKLADLLVGTWRYESVEMPGTPAAAKKAVEDEMKTAKIEFKDGKFVSYMKDKVFSTEAYEIEGEEGRKLTVKLPKTKKTEVYEFTDDDTLVMSDKELGKMVLKRAK